MFDIWHSLGEMLMTAFTNVHVKIGVISLLIAQFLKMFFYYLENKRFNFKVFVNGGMPSLHTAAVVGLATSVGIVDGWNSVTYAIAIIFSIIVMYDAAGVRRAAGKQARVLNKIMDDLATKKHIKENRLKELLGHTQLEVFFGFLLGLFIAFGIHYLSY